MDVYGRVGGIHIVYTRGRACVVGTKVEVVRGVVCDLNLSIRGSLRVAALGKPVRRHFDDGRSEGTVSLEG